MTEKTATNTDHEQVGSLQRKDLEAGEARSVAVRLAAVGVSDEALLALVDADELEAVRAEAGLSAEELAAA